MSCDSWWSSSGNLSKELGIGLGWHYLLDLSWAAQHLAPLDRGMQVLNAGAGTGVMQWWLAEQGVNVISVDRSSRYDLPRQFRLRYLVEGWRPGLLPSDPEPRLIVVKAVMPTQPGTSVYAPEVPTATELATGDRVEETLKLGFPNRLYNPHWPFGNRQGLIEVTCRALGMRVGYALASDVAALDTKPEVGNTTAGSPLQLPFLKALEVQRTIDSALVPIEGTLLLRG